MPTVRYERYQVASTYAGLPRRLLLHVRRPGDVVED